MRALIFPKHLALHAYQHLPTYMGLPEAFAASAPQEGQKNTPEPHPSGASHEQCPANISANNTPQLHPVGVNFEQGRNRETISLSCIPREQADSSMHVEMKTTLRTE